MILQELDPAVIPKCRVCGKLATGGYIIGSEELNSCLEHPMTDDEILLSLKRLLQEGVVRVSS